MYTIRETGIEREGVREGGMEREKRRERGRETAIKERVASLCIVISVVIN